MKLVEKLAREFDLNYVGDYYGDPNAAYQAGFRKALELALECVLNGEEIPNSSYTRDIEEAISGLADQEIK